MEVKIQIPDNCELIKSGDTYIVKEKDKPRSWEELRSEKDIWEGATSFCSGTEIWNESHRYVIRTSLIDFKELKNRTLADIDSKIEALEKEFEKL